jgi:hypothetical protein
MTSVTAPIDALLGRQLCGEGSDPVGRLPRRTTPPSGRGRDTKALPKHLPAVRVADVLNQHRLQKDAAARLPSSAAPWWDIRCHASRGSSMGRSTFRPGAPLCAVRSAVRTLCRRGQVERPRDGDETRSWGPPFVKGSSAYFQAVNRGKRSVAIRPRPPRGPGPGAPAAGDRRRGRRELPPGGGAATGHQCRRGARPLPPRGPWIRDRVRSDRTDGVVRRHGGGRRGRVRADACDGEPGRRARALGGRDGRHRDRSLDADRRAGRVGRARADGTRTVRAGLAVRHGDQRARNRDHRRGRRPPPRARGGAPIRRSCATARTRPATVTSSSAPPRTTCSTAWRPPWT